jgi:hypothetical protein
LTSTSETIRPIDMTTRAAVAERPAAGNGSPEQARIQGYAHTTQSLDTASGSTDTATR